MKCLKIFLFAGLCSFGFADTTHIIEKGDTLYSLSRKYGISVDQICSSNSITKDTAIKIGQKLLIPDGKTASASEKSKSSETVKIQEPVKPKETTAKVEEKSSNSSQTEETKTATETVTMKTTLYTVAKGDTWYGISRKNGITVLQLWAMNNVDSTAELKAGQKIKIPASGAFIAASDDPKPEPVKTDSKSSSSKEDKSKKETAKADDSRTSVGKKPDSSKVTSVEKVAPLTDPKTYTKTGDTSLTWPVKARKVNYVNGKVGGVQIICAKNEPVKAIASGNVMFSGSYRGFGNVVFIQSKTSHIYAYTGLGAITVSKGDYVVSGKEIGKAGVDALSKQNGVSLMVFQNGLPIDPAKAPRG